jgi:hypothetical protein
MTKMELFGCIASNAIGGLSVTPDSIRTYDKSGGPGLT